jgi:hypothetical protein
MRPSRYELFEKVKTDIQILNNEWEDLSLNEASETIWRLHELALEATMSLYTAFEIRKTVFMGAYGYLQCIPLIYKGGPSLSKPKRFINPLKQRGSSSYIAQPSDWH